MRSRSSDASVSSHHAELRREGEDYRLTDIGSTNGTHVNGDALPENDEQAAPSRRRDHLRQHHRAVPRAGRRARRQPLPAEAEPQLAPATTSVAPVDFSNASPFKKKGTERDKVALAVYAFAVLALLSAGAAIYLTMQIQAPTPM